jgi:hypothetical protein
MPAPGRPNQDDPRTSLRPHASGRKPEPGLTGGAWVLLPNCLEILEQRTADHRLTAPMSLDGRHFFNDYYPVRHISS